nr:MAG TPA: hypothetical protein [Caudoviricetes sp.]
MGKTNNSWLIVHCMVTVAREHYHERHSPESVQAAVTSAGKYLSG